jgi:hypothetical protein
MVVAHHVADDPRALEEATIRPVPAVVHRVQDADVDRLQAVADVGQRTADDDRHRIVEEAALHLDLDVNGLDPAPSFRRSVRRGHIWHLRVLPSAARRHGCTGGCGPVPIIRCRGT